MKSPILWTSKNGSGGVLCLPCFELKLGEGLMRRGDRLEGCCYSVAARQRRRLLCRRASAPATGRNRAGHRLPAAGVGRSRVAVERSKEGRVGLRGSAGEVWNLN